MSTIVSRSTFVYSETRADCIYRYALILHDMDSHADVEIIISVIWSYFP